MRQIKSTFWGFMLLIVSMALPSAVWADGGHRLTVVAKPTMAGTFNKSEAELVAGQTIQLVAYANANFDFLRWTDQSGKVVSQQMSFTYIMPSHDVQLAAEYEYNPANPQNPATNYWNKELGEVIIDDFTTGHLQNAVTAAISGSKTTDVTMITVAGVMNDNDFGIANNYTNCALLDLSRVTGVTAVPSYAFDNTHLESVYLPSTIESIGQQAFAGCGQLTSLIIYAMTPPTLGSNVFRNVPEGLVVYVPAAAIAQYQDANGWKDFTLLPIQEDIRSITVSLPASANAADYAQMWLELTNTKSGQRMHYVMTDRQTYTFANIIRNTSWNVTLRNERSDVFGHIDNVEVKDEDVSVTFGALSKPQSVVLSVLTPDGQDVTAQTQVTWTDAQGNYLAQGISLAGLPTGFQATCHVALSQELAVQYITPQPVEYVLTDSDNKITCQLTAIPQVKITGKVKDASTGLPLSGAVISASQTFGGKYSKTLNAKTDANGVFMLDIANVPTSVAFAASDYVCQTINCDSLLIGAGEVTLPDVSLKNITGATIALGFTYTSCEGETQNWYSDYQNVSYELFNVTKNQVVSQYNVQYPQIVLLEEVADGDVLRLTATSRTNAFMPVTATATIEEQKAEATFAVVELGKIQSSFTSTGNAAVVGSLYDSTGKLVKTYNYSNASLTISNLADGNYTLVSMGSSRLFNTIYDLSQLQQTGLAEGTDYVQNSVEVKSGQVSAINISEVPTLDESKLYYTGDNTSFTVNKPSIVAGNYLTLTGRIDFKPTYATSVSNVQIIVDLPESCEFVENSVMVGNSTSSYTLNGHQITIPMARYTDRVRFCIIPTLGGEYAPSAFVLFDLNGETVTQPIGSANYTAKDLSISVPSTVAKTAIPVSGTAIGTSNVEIYDNDVLIGQTTSMANGTWATTCELNEPYNLSSHNIFAKVTTKTGIELQSETLECLYDKNAIEVKTVTMINTAHTAANLQLHDYVTVFDFQNPDKPIPAYWYWPSYPDFTFLVDFTNNDTTLINDVILNVFTSSNDIRKLYPKYNAKKGAYVVSEKFNSSSLPINVSVSFTANTILEIDSVPINKERDELSLNMAEHLKENKDIVALLDSLSTELQKEDPSEEQIYQIITTIVTRHSRPLEDEISNPNYPYFDDVKTPEDLERIIKNYPHPDLDEIEKSLPNLTPAYQGTVVPAHLDGINPPTISYDFTNGYELFRKNTSSEGSGNIYIPDNYWTVIDNEENTSIVRLRNRAGDIIVIDDSKNFTDPPQSLNDYQEQCNYWTSYGGFLSDELKEVSNYIDLTSLELQIMTNAVEQSYWLYIDGFNATYRLEATPRVQLLRHNFAENIMREQRTLQRLNTTSTILGVVSTFFSAHNTVKDGFSAWESYKDWDDIIKSIHLLCDQPTAQEIAKEAQGYKEWIGRRKLVKTIGGTVLTYGAVFSTLAAPETFGASIPFACLCFGGGLALDFWGYNCSKTNQENVNSIINKVNGNKEKCKPFGYENLIYPSLPDVSYVLDPSGYVYEGVFSNRLEGVTATAYYKETIEDMYGDLHENIVKWDAEEYAQENPLFTDENGFYRWDVPQGLWQVKFEKEGYETTYSEWLPVPPPQLDVNIAMKQNRQPEVKAARAYEDAVEVEFDKYMMPELLTAENVMVMQNNTAVEGTIELLNEEESYEGGEETFASKIRFNAAQPFTEQEVTLMVNNRVRSYAGIRMQDNYQQTFTIEQEIKQIVSDSVVTVGYGNASTLIVSVLPASASKGKTLTVKTSSPMILGVETEQVTIGDDGKAEITVSGELPGTAALTFSVEGTDKTAMTIANVEQIVIKTVDTPKASIASGTVVEKGTTIKLTCETEGATIYYTLDGSCPCDNTDARQVYDGTPIIINESVTIKAMAMAPNMYESDVAEFVYMVDDESGIADVTVNGQIQIYPLPVHDKVNISAGGKVIKSVTISSMNGTTVASANKASKTVTLDVSAIATGIYIVNIQTEDGTYSRKILKL